MKIIKKIEIYRFRSFADETIYCDSDIVIFSGANNAGKSNVLKALNLFFTNQTGFNQNYIHSVDYNKAFTESAGGARKIVIKLHFSGRGNGALKFDFNVSREFYEDTLPSDYKFGSENKETDDRIVAGDGLVFQQFRRFVNTLKYIYVPAIRSPEFVQSVLIRLEELLNKEGKKYDASLESLATLLSERTDKIGEEFQKFIGLPTKVETPTSIVGILKTMQIQVSPGISVKIKNKTTDAQKEVGIYSSGDGIVMAYLPHFLHFLATEQTNKHYIWGFEEPENSLEYARVQSLAQKFIDKFSNDVQIFMTTHSPAFINLKDDKKTKFFRVYREEWSKRKSTKVADLDSIRDAIPKAEPGMNEVLCKELAMAEFNNEIEKLIKEQMRIKVGLEAELREARKITRPLVLVEGNSDAIILQAAYDALGGESEFGDLEFFKMPESAPGGDKGLGVKILRNHLNSDLPKFRTKRIVGIFDRDRAGIDCFNTLTGFQPVAAGICKVKEGKKIYGAILLPIPALREDDYKSVAKLNSGDTLNYFNFETEDYLAVENKCKNWFVAKSKDIRALKIGRKRKMEFARYIAENSRAINFNAFKPLLEEISILLELK
jgi:AAA15 family ATPase/GTPase